MSVCVCLHVGHRPSPPDPASERCPQPADCCDFVCGGVCPGLTLALPSPPCLLFLCPCEPLGQLQAPHQHPPAGTVPGLSEESQPWLHRPESGTSGPVWSRANWPSWGRVPMVASQPGVQLQEEGGSPPLWELPGLPQGWWPAWHKLGHTSHQPLPAPGPGLPWGPLWRRCHQRETQTISVTSSEMVIWVSQTDISHLGKPMGAWRGGRLPVTSY